MSVCGHQRLGLARDPALTLQVLTMPTRAVAHGVDGAHAQGQPLAQAQAHAVQGEVEDLVAQGAGGIEEGLRLLDGDDVGQPLALGWANEIGHLPELAQHVQGVELQAVHVMFDGAPGVGGEQLAEVVGGKLARELVVPVAEILAHASDGACRGINRLGLQALELQVLEVGLVALLKRDAGCWSWRDLLGRYVAQSPHPD